MSASPPPGERVCRRVLTRAAKGAAAAAARARMAGRGLRRVLWYIWVGMGATNPMGGIEVPLPQDAWDEVPAKPRRVLTGPPPSHPERLIPGVPPSPREWALWVQLADFGTVARPAGREADQASDGEGLF